MDSVQLLVFEVSTHLFAVEIARVEEVIKYQPLTAAPGAVHSIAGLVDLRGTPIPVIDLHELFELKIQDNYNRARIVISENSGYIVGLVVSNIKGVYHLNLSDFSEPPQGTNSESKPYTVGLGHFEGKILTLLNVDKLLDLSPIAEKEVV